jgi:uncharacterized protein YggE
MPRTASRARNRVRVHLAPHTIRAVEREIVVRGEGEVHALPDRAVVHVRVDGEGASREEAYDTTARLVAAVDAVLAAEADGIDRVVTTALVVQPRTRWRKGESVRTGWRSARTSVVEIVTLDRVGALLAQVVAAGGAISGPTWELAPGHPAHDEARQAAAADARRRADAYAASLGLTVGPVAWIAEPGLRLGTPATVYGARMVRAAAAAGGSMSEEPIEVNPEEIAVHAAVEVGFSINDQ